MRISGLPVEVEVQLKLVLALSFLIPFFTWSNGSAPNVQHALIKVSKAIMATTFFIMAGEKVIFRERSHPSPLMSSTNFRCQFPKNRSPGTVPIEESIDRVI